MQTITQKLIDLNSQGKFNEARKLADKYLNNTKK
jgi:hypothetical protein